MATDSVTKEILSENVLGQVKWFNTNTGFGFITVMSDGMYKTEDIFVHHSDLSVGVEQYRYLQMGEYVNFKIMKSDDEHKFKASDVTGVQGGKLMCEIRHDVRQQQPQAPRKRPSTGRNPRGGAPRGPRRGGGYRKGGQSDSPSADE
tara:strand:- start:99 stop:539 length:441 start_codon:yes stop_codon:yes gene_type:complete